MLVCLRWGIGDLVMQLPALGALRRVTPGAHVVAVGASPATQLLEAGDIVDEVVDVRSKGVDHIGINEAPEFAAWLDGQRRFDLVLDTLHAAAAVREIIWSLGYVSVECDQAVQDAATRRGEGLTRASTLAAASGWGVDIDEDASPALTLRDEDEAWADDMVGNDVPAAVAPVASLDLKRWPAQRFEAVLEQLATEHGRVFVFCGDDTSAAEQFSEQRQATVVGPEPLLHQAALLKRCGLYVGNDTGLMHIAAAVGLPVVGLFGPSSANVILPRHVEARGLGRACDCPYRDDATLKMPDCWQTGTCLHDDARSCIDRVGVDAVLSAVTSINVKGRRPTLPPAPASTTPVVASRGTPSSEPPLPRRFVSCV